MKYWLGYLTAAIFAAITWVLVQVGQQYATLVDMVYPYVTRSVQTFLTAWTGGVDFLLWQLVLLLLVVIVLAVLVLMVVFRPKISNVIRWIGWVLAVASMLFCLNTGLYGLNHYAGPIEDDLRLEMTDYTQTELESAAVFYRDKALELADQITRDETGAPVYPAFEELAAMTGNGYRKLVLERSFSIFGGDYTPVKKLGWSGLFSGMGVSGVTCFLTGESAVNPDIPVYAQPFAMAKETARRLCVARDADSDFAAFLSCAANESVEYQYSAYFMAYRCCRDALYGIDSAAADAIDAAVTGNLARDLTEYSNFFSEHQDVATTRLRESIGDVYQRAADVTTGTSTEETTGDPGDPQTTIIYSSLCDFLVNWHLSEYTDPTEEITKFDPFDETQVDLSGLVNANIPEETEPAE